MLGSSVAIAVLLRAGRGSGLGARCMWWVYGLGCSHVHMTSHTRYAYRRGAISVSPLLAVREQPPSPASVSSHATSERGQRGAGASYD